MSVDDYSSNEYLLPMPHTGARIYRRGRDRDNEAARLKAMGWDLEDIAVQLQFGDPPSAKQAAAAIRRALATMARFAGDEMRLMELKSLDELEWAAWRTLQNRHVLVQQGRVIEDETGRPLEDDRYVLEVLDRILRIKERRSKLMGLDAPTRAEVLTIDSVEAEIMRLEAEVSRQNQPG